MKYKYVAIDNNGERTKEVANFENETELSKYLHSKGLFLVSAEPVKSSKKASISFLKKVSLSEKMFFIRHLKVMISAGLSLSKALDALEKQTKNNFLKEAVITIKDDVKSGKRFSEALLRHPAIFSEFFYNMIRASEESGTTEEVLGILSDHIEKEYSLKSKIKGALIYPAVIISAMLGVGVIMLVFVIPQLAQTFKEMELELPNSTQAIISIGGFLANNLILIPVAIIGIAFSTTLFLRTKTGKRVFSWISLKIPLIATFTRNTSSAHISRTLSSLLNSGTSITRSLEIVTNTLGNLYFQDAIAATSEKVKKGEKLSEALSQYDDILSPLIIQMVEVGEETGETSSLLLKVAEFLEEEVEATTKNLTSIIEPILMILIGVAIGFFAISMLQPMYSMLGAF